MSNLVKVAHQDLAKLEQLHNQAGAYIRQAKANNTWRAYKADWNDFDNWCHNHQLSPLPATPATVALYLTERAETHKISTLQRRLAAITQYHIGNHHADPTKGAEAKETWKGIRRAKGIATKQKAPAIIEVIRSMVDTLSSDSLLGVRDRALLLLGFAGAFRRSELVGLNLEDLEFNRDGLVITLRKSKTDQEGQGRKVGIPYGSNPQTCPVRNAQSWLEISGIDKGAIFRPINRYEQISQSRLSDKAVALIVKRCAQAAKLDPSTFAGHSLRAGLATSAAAAGASERAIMDQTGHKNVQMVRRYIRDGNLFRDNAAGKVGL